MKKIVLTLLSIACAFCCTIGFAACGEKHEHIYRYNGVCSECGDKQPPSEEVQYTVSEDGTYAYVSGWKATKDIYQNPNLPYVMIAETYEGKPVTAIGDKAFSGKKDIMSVIIPNSVTHIGNSAFSGCSYLKRVTIPDSVISIGNSAFAGCGTARGDGLEKITIPDSVTSIGVKAFAECISLESVTIPDSVTSIGNGAFEYCSKLKSVIFPCKVASIGIGIFAPQNDNYYNQIAIYFNGTAQDIENVSGYASILLEKSIRASYYYSETEPAEDGTCWHYDTDGVTPKVWSK